MHPSGDPLIPYRVRTVRLAVQATWLVLVALGLLVALPHVHFPKGPYMAVLGVAAAGVSMIQMLPWKRLFERGVGIRLMHVWSAFDILLITVLLGIVGPENLEIFSIYAITTLFFAASYPPKGQVALLVFTWGCYLTLLGATGWGPPVGSIVARLSILGVTTFLASFLSRELMRQIEAHRDARSESERRSDLLGAVAGAARGIASLDSDRVLAAVVESAASLGFDSAELCIVNPETNTYRISHGHAVPPAYGESEHSANLGLVGMVLERHETVVVDDYSNHPMALPAVRDDGYRAVIGSPVWSKGKLAAVLNAGTKQRREITSQEREAFELLAALAGRALENARRFEDERRTVERLAELDRLKQDFLSMVSHEMRTPLTVIEGMGLTLQDRWEQLEEPIRREFIQLMNKNSKALDGIITTLLDFSQLEAGKLTLRPANVDLGAAVAEVVSRLSGLLTEHLVMTEADGGLIAVVDPLLFDRVIENMISNAAKHTPPGTGILVSVKIDGDAALVSVADDGPGIAKADLPRVGERFFRGGDPNSRTTRGVGLGLAFVQEILDQHGSRLQVESEQGKGTRFSFRLPLLPGTAETRISQSGSVSDEVG